MKALIVSLVLSISASAFAGQTISCVEINKSGSKKVKGGSLALQIVTNADGTVNDDASLLTTSGFLRDKSDTSYSQMTVRSVGEGVTIQGQNEFTTVFLTPVQDDGMLDIQLQFDTHIVGKTFSKTPATFVIGSDDANPETSFAFGFKVVCESQLN